MNCTIQMYRLWAIQMYRLWALLYKCIDYVLYNCTIQMYRLWAADPSLSLNANSHTYNPKNVLYKCIDYGLATLSSND